MDEAQNKPEVPVEQKDFEPTDRVKLQSQAQRSDLFGSMHAVLKEKGDNVEEVTQEKYAEIILGHMASSDLNYQIVAFEILKHTLAIPYEEQPEKFEKYLKDIKDFKEAAEKMKKGFGWFSFGEEGHQKKRVNKFIKVLKEIVVYLEKIKKLDEEEKAGFDKPESEKKLTSGQEAVLSEKQDLKKYLDELEKELELNVKASEKKEEGVAEVVDLEKARREKAGEGAGGIAAGGTDVVTLKAVEGQKAAAEGEAKVEGMKKAA